jgi:hypothetical protein
VAKQVSYSEDTTQVSELSTLHVKSGLLDNADYAYNFDRAVYFNRKARKIFSVEFIEDHSPADLEKCIVEPVNGRDWRFYFNDPPSDSVRKQIEASLN